MPPMPPPAPDPGSSAVARSSAASRRSSCSTSCGVVAPFCGPYTAAAPARPEQRIVDVERGDQLDTVRHRAQRQPQPLTAVARRRASDADDDPARTATDHLANQLAGAERACSQDVGLEIGDSPHAARLGNVERSLAPGQLRVRRLDRTAIGVVRGHPPPRTAARRQQRRRRALAAVRQRHQLQLVTRPARAPATCQRLGSLGGRVGALELVRGDHEAHHARE